MIPSLIANDPIKAGQRASKSTLFGENSRYAVYAVHTRFEDVQWFVADAEQTDPVTGLCMIIRQRNSKEDAIASI